MFFSLLSLFGCEKNTLEPSLSEIFNSLPELTEPSTSDMKTTCTSPHLGPIFCILKYKDDTLVNETYRQYFIVVNSDCAYSVYPSSLFFAHKYKVHHLPFDNILSSKDLDHSYWFDLRNFELKIDNSQENIYIRTECWTMDDVERFWAGEKFIGRIIYFCYSLRTYKFFSEDGQKIESTNSW